MRTLKLLLVVTTVLVALLITPILARLGKPTEVARWTSPTPLYGVKIPIWLIIDREVAYVDVFSLYPCYRLYITDGGYAYERDFDVPSKDFKSYFAHCQVIWQTNGVDFITPDSETNFIPDQLIRRQIGSD
jgi:hypothetical protein